ncbi:3-hydroxyacyl-CoA dehydrogenase family protein [Cyclobacterium marinum]|uniref:3-hydroxyacyl-CoA dehydrogenase family protein n=1 Tax=Cyclobacterium marinum TaxID=104 RepID=UPI0030D8CC39|tara:strand:- start:14010 stop:14927 length:918 start_codon:yes stop_codon:yes gene_type:complete
MKNNMTPSEINICLLGDGKNLSGIALCLGNSGHKVFLPGDALPKSYLTQALEAQNNIFLDPNWSSLPNADLIIIHCSENILLKKELLGKISDLASATVLVGINSESYALTDLQEGFPAPERLIGLNWVYPAHQTLFLEIITNEKTKPEPVEKLMKMAKSYWDKDPYLLCKGKGIRSRLLAAMARESFHLIDKGYAEPIDIDRACRNDPGYYLPFAGNFRYMDLMGTFIYGLVMKDLNPELSNDKTPSKIIDDKINAGKLGMDKGEGFYSYSENEMQDKEEDFLIFNKKIKGLMDKYPFKNPEEVV